MAAKKQNEVGKDGLPIRVFVSQAAWLAWLSKSHASAAGIWVKVAKKGSGHASVDIKEALDGALAWGWIDSQRLGYDDEWYLQRYSPRTSKSPWSKINRDKVAALAAAGAMQPPGLAEVERAKADGRWDAAYDGARTATVPEDLAAALAENAKARKAFEGLNGQNRYAILFRLQTAKKAETRASRIAKFVEMLARGELLHPLPTKR